jgi:hypothetical protein
MGEVFFNFPHRPSSEELSGHFPRTGGSHQCLPSAFTTATNRVYR